MAFSVPPPHPAAAAAAAGAVSSSAGARTQTIDRIIGSRRDALAAGFRGRGRPARAVWSAGGRQTTSFAFRVQCSASNRGAEVSVSNLGYLFPNDATALTNGSSNAGSSGLSARGRSLKPLTKVMERVQPIVEAVQKNPYDASSNPGGVIDMGLAQSRLAWDLLKEGVSGPRGLTTLHAYYGPYRGLASFRASLAPFLETFLGAAVRPDDLILAPGTTGAIDALANVLFDAGDAILLAAPYYYYFDVDLSYRAQLRLVPVKTDPSSGFAWRPEDFEATLEAAEAAGLRVKGILVCNPDNPLGRTVTREQLSGLMDLCVRRGLHLISDEVYANNVHGAAGGEFVSAWEVAAGSPAEQRVHVAWGFSKDFGLSGYRVGIAVPPAPPPPLPSSGPSPGPRAPAPFALCVAASRNGAAVEAMSTLSRFSGVSSDTQARPAPYIRAFKPSSSAALLSLEYRFAIYSYYAKLKTGA
eukprot:tig00020902_g14948.t1